MRRSVLVRIEFVSTRHHDDERPQRVQDLHGAFLRGEHLGQAPVGVRALIEATATEDDPALPDPFLHHLRRDAPGRDDRAGLPVPRWSLSRKGLKLESVGYPAICKPAAEDASIGIEQRSVVKSGRALGARLEAMHERWDDIVVQHYVDGREVNVGIVDDQILPVAEIHFDEMPRGMWKIVSYQSKWITGSEEDLGAKPTCPADLPAALTKELERIAITAWRAVGGSGYGRVDFRIDAEGQPWLLEVNPNPDISPDAGLARMARVAGMDYNALIKRICEAGLKQRIDTSPELWQRSLHLSGMSALLAATP